MLALRTSCGRFFTALLPKTVPTGLKIESGVLPQVPVRYAGSHLQSRNANELWKAVTSVSSQGRQRGRAKGLIKYKNLHRGQRLGMGKARVSFPGLTTHASKEQRGRDTKVTSISEEDYEKYLESIQEAQSKSGLKRGRGLGFQTPLERGWTGSSPQGKHFGPPISESFDGHFDNFDSVLLEQRQLNRMDGSLGRVRIARILMAVGNKNGTAGFALIASKNGRGPGFIQKAINRAGKQLITVPLYENRTVYHDFFSNFGKSRVMVKQKPPGHGIVAHRVIKSICEIIGIKDIEAVVDSSTRNYVHITKAFFLGLMRQRTHQELANEKGLYLVEFRDENDNFPLVVAKPDNGQVRTQEQILPNEILDFEMISYDGHLPLWKAQKKPFWENLRSYELSQRKRRPLRHHRQQMLDMMVENGRVASHLTDKYPECKPAEGTPREAPEGWLELREKLRD